MPRLNGKADILRHFKGSNGRGWTWESLLTHHAPIYRDGEHRNLLFALTEDLDAWSKARAIPARVPVRRPERERS